MTHLKLGPDFLHMVQVHTMFLMVATVVAEKLVGPVSCHVEVLICGPFFTDSVSTVCKTRVVAQGRQQFAR